MDRSDIQIQIQLLMDRVYDLLLDQTPTGSGSDLCLIESGSDLDPPDLIQIRSIDRPSYILL